MTMSGSFETILLEVDEGVALVTLNRPEVRNALNLQMVEDLRAAFAELSLRDDVRAVIVV